MDDVGPACGTGRGSGLDAIGVATGGVGLDAAGGGGLDGAGDTCRAGLDGAGGGGGLDAGGGTSGDAGVRVGHCPGRAAG